MDSLIGILKAVSILCAILFFADLFFGNLWASTAKRIFKKLSDVMLAGAVIDLYHDNIGAILIFADRNIGRFVPTARVAITVFLGFALIFLSGGMVQAIQEGKPLVPYFFHGLLAFSFAAVISASFCYTITYFVLHLISNGLDAFVPKYLYLVSIEILASYFLAPLAYASLFLVVDYTDSGLGGYTGN